MKEETTMRRLILAFAAFAVSLGVGASLAPRPVEAAKPATCPYCHGDRCGRGSLGSAVCEMTADGRCTESGECIRD